MQDFDKMCPTVLPELTICLDVQHSDYAGMLRVKFKIQKSSANFDDRWSTDAHLHEHPHMIRID